MTGEIWVAAAAIITTTLGAISYWTRKVDRVAARMEAVVESIEEFKKDSTEDRRDIHRRLDNHDSRINKHGERISGIAAYLRKRPA